MILWRPGLFNLGPRTDGELPVTSAGRPGSPHPRLHGNEDDRDALPADYSLSPIIRERAVDVLFQETSIRLKHVRVRSSLMDREPISQFESEPPTIINVSCGSSFSLTSIAGSPLVSVNFADAGRLTPPTRAAWWGPTKLD